MDSLFCFQEELYIMDTVEARHFDELIVFLDSISCDQIDLGCPDEQKKLLLSHWIDIIKVSIRNVIVVKFE